MNENKLKPCPFCGGEAYIEGVNVFWAVCNDCGVETVSFDNEIKAIECWNNRVSETGEGIVSVEDIDEAPTVDTVPKGLFDQIKWERDVAIGQLEQIGCGLGQKMDDVKAKLDAVPVVHEKWENDASDIPRCSGCSYIPEFNIMIDDYYYSNFCPNCGARMDGKEADKIKTPFAIIKVSGNKEKPYYGIAYYDPTDRYFHEGFGSYNLNFVRQWLEQKFEIIHEPEVEYVPVVRCKDCKHYTDNINDDNLRDGFCNKSKDKYFDSRMPNDFCNYGEMKDDGSERSN